MLATTRAAAPRSGVAVASPTAVGAAVGRDGAGEGRAASVSFGSVRSDSVGLATVAAAPSRPDSSGLIGAVSDGFVPG